MTKTAHYQLAQSDTQLYRQTDPVDPLAATSPTPFKHLTFPLNVYAHALLLEAGKADYLHFGLFQNDQTSLQAAQQFSTDLLISKLPPPPCRILEVGVGLGTTFSLLNKRGYDVHGITPDAQQIAYIQESQGAGISISCHALEDFTAPAGSFDVVLFQESAQYIEPLDIFNKALDLLPLQGDLLIIDEFALKRTQAGMEGLHHLDEFVALAQRFGFDLIEQIDLSTMAAPTLEYMLSLVSKHQDRIINDLELSNAMLTQLNASNHAYREKYANQRFGYGLLHFKKRAQPKWRLRQIKTEHMSAVLDLFENTFHHSMTPATWQWKYGHHSGYQIGVWRDDQLIAHYGGCGRRILFFGQPQHAVQIADVMVNSNDRGILTKTGPFFLMAATFPERFVGYGKPFLVGFGFPNERAMQVAERHGLYAEVGCMTEFCWPSLPKLPLMGTKLQQLDEHLLEDDKTARIIDECWQQMAGDLRDAMVGIRDWNYLKHRYLHHPTQQYQIVLVKNRFGKRIRGVLVLRHDSMNCEIMDMIAPLSEIPLLIKHARRIAGIAGYREVSCRITENFASYFANTRGIQHPLNIHIPATIWTDGPSVETLRNHWWLMSGDTDFR